MAMMIIYNGLNKKGDVMINKILKISFIFLVIGLIGMIVQKVNAFTIQEHLSRMDRLEEAQK